MRKGKLTQAALARSVLRTLEKRREDVVKYPAYGCGYGAFYSGGQITVTACGSSAGIPKTAPEFSVHEACGHLLAACAAGTGKEELSQTVDFLKQYAQTHFRHEEGLQIESGYPDYENHKKYHEALMNMVDDLSNRLKIEGPTLQLMGEINKQLGIWLINHIKTEDTKVARHIQAWEGHGDGH